MPFRATEEIPVCRFVLRRSFPCAVSCYGGVYNMPFRATEEIPVCRFVLRRSFQCAISCYGGASSVPFRVIPGESFEDNRFERRKGIPTLTYDIKSCAKSFPTCISFRLVVYMESGKNVPFRVTRGSFQRVPFRVVYGFVPVLEIVSEFFSRFDKSKSHDCSTEVL